MTKVWGPITWIFIHSFSQQISEKCFLKNKNEILRIIKNICTNVPCSECSKHASQYFNKYFKNINNKDNLIYFLHTFHNNVNSRLKKPIFQDLQNYKTSKLKNIFDNFKIIYLKKYNLVKDFHNIMFKKRLIEDINKFFIKNKDEILWL